MQKETRNETFISYINIITISGIYFYYEIDKEIAL